MADLITTHYINKTHKELNEKINELWNYLYYMGGYKKFVEAGTYTFKVLPGIETIVVSAIGAGGGGGGGGGAYRPNASSTNFRNAGSGGGGGGRGEYILNQTIEVNAGETLTLIVGAAGEGGAAGDDGEAGSPTGQNPGNGANGKAGTATILKRGEEILLTASNGTGGNGGIKGRTTGVSVSGGLGGDIGGSAGGDTTKNNSSDQGYASPGSGGAAGICPEFGSYGNGGQGGYGGYGNYNTYARSGGDGRDGALVICFGGYQFEDVKW